MRQKASGGRRPLQDMSYSPWEFVPASLAAAWLVAACQKPREQTSYHKTKLAQGTNGRRRGEVWRLDRFRRRGCVDHGREGADYALLGLTGLRQPRPVSNGVCANC